MLLSFASASATNNILFIRKATLLNINILIACLICLLICVQPTVSVNNSGKFIKILFFLSIKIVFMSVCMRLNAGQLL